MTRSGREGVHKAHVRFLGPGDEVPRPQHPPSGSRGGQRRPSTRSPRTSCRSFGGTSGPEVGRGPSMSIGVSVARRIGAQP